MRVEKAVAFPVEIAEAVIANSTAPCRIVQHFFENTAGLHTPLVSEDPLAQGHGLHLGCEQEQDLGDHCRGHERLWIHIGRDLFIGVRLGGPTQNWAHLALSNGTLLIRDQTELMCVKVGQ
jgi:hypothetical protein